MNMNMCRYRHRNNESHPNDVDDEGNAEDVDEETRSELNELDDVDAVVGKVKIDADAKQEGTVSNVELENDREENVETASVKEEMNADVLVGNEEFVSDNGEEDDDDDPTVEENEDGNMYLRTK